MAIRLAEAVGVEQGLRPEPATAEEIEAAYLRRMKAKEALLGPPQVTELPPAIQGKPVASYMVNVLEQFDAFPAAQMPQTFPSAEGFETQTS